MPPATTLEKLRHKQAVGTIPPAALASRQAAVIRSTMRGTEPWQRKGSPPGNRGQLEHLIGNCHVFVLLLYGLRRQCRKLRNLGAAARWRAINSAGQDRFICGIERAG